jgi:hypothetical protein
MTRGPLPKHPEAAHATLPAEGCPIPAPPWPYGKPSADELSLWRDLWSRPIAAMWHAQRIPPVVVSRYVAAWFREAADPKAHLGSTLARLEGELALTPGALARLHLKVAPAAETAAPAANGAALAEARRRWEAKA